MKKLKRFAVLLLVSALSLTLLSSCCWCYDLGTAVEQLFVEVMSARFNPYGYTLDPALCQDAQKVLDLVEDGKLLASDIESLEFSTAYFIQPYSLFPEYLENDTIYPMSPISVNDLADLRAYLTNLAVFGSSSEGVTPIVNHCYAPDKIGAATKKNADGSVYLVVICLFV